jgi:hypothetical protein
VPRLKNVLLAGRWIMPTGDPECLRFAKTWQNELGAFGWRDGKLEGVGERDDTVIASWLIEFGVARVMEQFALMSTPEVIVTMEDFGVYPVHYGEPYLSDPLEDELRRLRDEERYS